VNYKIYIPVFVYNPADFDPARLPEELRDGARVFLDAIGKEFYARDRDDLPEFVPLKAAYLRELIGRFPDPQRYIKVREALLSLGIIETDGWYEEGKKSLGFRATSNCLWVRTCLEHRENEDRVRAVRATLTPRLRKPHHVKLKQHLDLLDLDYEGAMRLMNCPPCSGSLSLPSAGQTSVLPTITNLGELTPGQRLNYQLSLERIRNKEWTVKVDRQGRVHTNLTNLKSEFRRFLSVKGKHLIALDLRNSQPLLFSLLLKNCFSSPPSSLSLYDVRASWESDEKAYKLRRKVGFQCLPTDDAKTFIELCERGTFYEWVMSHLRVPQEQRDTFKPHFFGRIFYSKRKGLNREQKIFQSLFPTPWKLLRHLKRVDPRNAPLELQRLEAEIIIDGATAEVFRRLPEAPVFTIHDAILTTDDWINHVEVIWRDQFARYGITPSFKRQALQAA